MKAKAFATFLSLTILLSQTPVSSAQGPGALREWSAVTTLDAGDELVVLMRSGTTFKGKLKSASDAGLSLSRKNKTTDLARADVQRVYRVKGRSLRKATLIGLGVGAGIGAASGAVVAVTDGPAESGEEHLPIFWLGAAGAIVGTLSGITAGLLRRKKRVLVYDAP